MEPSKPSNTGQPGESTRIGQAGRDEQAAITRAAGLVGGLTLVSRVSGLVRDVVIGALFGASSAADAFFIAFRIPNLFRRVVAEGATSAAFVPVFSEEREFKGDAGALRAAAAVGGVAFLVLVAIVVFGMVFAKEIVTVFAPGFKAGTGDFDLAVRLTRAVFPYLLAVGLAAWAMGALHTFRRFTVPALGPILLNISIVTCALMFSGTIEEPVYALVAGVLIGGCFQFAVQIPTLARLGVRPSMLIAPGHAAVRKVGRLLLPALLGGAVYQINVLVATVFASLLPARSVSYLWYADRVFEFPLGIVAVAVGTAALPSMSGQARSGRLDELADTVEYSLRLVWALAIPATVGLFMLAPQIVGVLFERGAFTPEDTAMTAWALRAYVVAMIAVASTRVLVSAFYAMQLPRVPVVAACVALVVNAVADLALMGPPHAQTGWWGAGWIASAQAVVGVTDLRHAGLALGAGLAAMANAVILVVTLRTKVAEFSLAATLPSALRHVAAAVAMAVAVQLVIATTRHWGGAGQAVCQVLLAVPVGGAVYAAVAFALGSAEIRALVTALRPRRRG